jgi:5-methylcytosine-specific restriction endonuclease McrBC GTP-binding regulatory subunit McrB
MSDFQQQYAIWDEFLSVWPAPRLATMTLDEYSQAGSKDSFTYWIESRLDALGSIWGGSSFKFGVFSRKDTEDKKSDAKLSYSDTHGWYSSLGATAEEAFEKVRGYVVQVAKLAAKGDLDGIDALPLGEAFKWKIAFHYQNRQAPVIVDIFKRAPLAAFVGGTASQPMAALQRAALAQRPEGLGILEFGRQVWEAWSQKNLAIWKLSHGNPPNFTDAERQQYLDGQWAVMHRDTGKEQGKKFAEAPVGTLFFLCHGNSPQRIGQFTSEAMPCDKGDGWLQRSYRVLKPAQRTDRYTANAKGWSPQGNSTFWQVVAHDLPEFESTLLKPYFGTDLAELAALAGEPIEAASLGDGVAPPPIAAPSTANPRTATCFNRIYYGPPGTGKTYTLMQLLKRDYEPQDGATEQRYSFVTFHQSYGYEEFVEGLRPVLDGDGEAGEVAYEIRPGAFKELCRKARQAPDQRFAMVIDEINRGNISKIFGELITLIEPDKRDPLDGSKPPVELTLAYSGEKFSVPANVDIIGTMNTADRSLALLDTALRRRFDFVPLLPDTRAVKVPDEPHSAPLAGLVVTTDAGEIDVRRMLERINERIEVLYDRDHCIGHAYFTHLWRTTDGTQRFEALTDTFRNRVLPLLEEYFFEDWRKIRLVLGDNQKPDAAQFITESDAHDQALDELFGNDHGLDSGTTQRRHQLQPSAFVNPASYLGIYQPLA